MKMYLFRLLLCESIINSRYQGKKKFYASFKAGFIENVERREM
jgi:hypothetical protein